MMFILKWSWSTWFRYNRNNNKILSLKKSTTKGLQSESGHLSILTFRIKNILYIFKSYNSKTDWRKWKSMQAVTVTNKYSLHFISYFDIYFSSLADWVPLFLPPYTPHRIMVSTLTNFALARVYRHEIIRSFTKISFSLCQIRYCNNS